MTRILQTIRRWFDKSAAVDIPMDDAAAMRMDWFRVIPFLGMHAMCLGVIWVGWSWAAVGVAVALYFLRMFAVTGFYHRYFSHRTFKTSRAGQFVLAVAGSSAVQKGPLWWAAHHRHHHRHSDTPEDLHSPRQGGLWWSHMGWITCRKNVLTNFEAVPDLAKYPELMFLDRFDVVVPALLAATTLGLGSLLAAVAPQLGTNGPQMLVWGFFISTIVLFHGTCTINSLSHLMGRQRYETGDDSRNSFILSLVTLGEGWHNNHHRFPGTTRQGFFWWEIDITYYGLKVMSWLRLIWDLQPPPKRAWALARGDDVAPSVLTPPLSEAST